MVKDNYQTRAVYICSPYSGEVARNVAAARRYCRLAVDRGCMPLAPHLLFPQFLNDAIPAERRQGLLLGMTLMSLCAEVWVFGLAVSAGMEAEIELALRRNLRLRYFNENCEEVNA